MKSIILIIIVAILASNVNAQNQPSIKIGTLEMFQEMTDQMVRDYFGEPEKTRRVDTEFDFERPRLYATVYEFDTDKERDLMIYNVSITDENRFRNVTVRVRDPKFALAGTVMVGDHISKFKELGFDNLTHSKKPRRITTDTYRIPDYTFNNKSYPYEVSVLYDENGIITVYSVSEIVDLITIK